MIARAAPESHFEWLEQRTKAVLTRHARAIEATDRESRIVGMVAFDLWTPRGVTVHIAIEKPIALRCLMRASAKYVFGQAVKDHVLGFVLSDNKKSKQLAKKIGFKEDHRIVQGWSDSVDMVIYRLDKKGSRWANG